MWQQGLTSIYICQMGIPIQQIQVPLQRVGNPKITKMYLSKLLCPHTCHRHIKTCAYSVVNA